ncbi:MAG: hypothetical protein WC247_11805 [Porticoccaceae bacterium]
MNHSPSSYDMLLVGSRALSEEGFKPRSHDSDWDIWITERYVRENLLAYIDFSTGDSGDQRAMLETPERRYSLRVIPEGDVRELFMRASHTRPLLGNDRGWPVRIASPAGTRLLKRALAYQPVKWHKNIEDYHRVAALTANMAATAEEEHAYQSLRAEMIAKLDSKLNGWTMRVKNQDFFADFKYPWLRAYEHDDLHRATCYGGRPLYTELKDDPSLAYIPQAAFEQLCHADKIRLVREEAYALALERVLIPAMDLGIAHSAESAFLHALRRISTTLARGWFREFAIDHYDEIKNYDKNFVDDYHRHCESGQLVKKPQTLARHERRKLLALYWKRLCENDSLAGLT